MGYLFGLLIGILLGLVGAGGSILTIPVLVYVVGISAVTATSYALFIVGTTALVGAYEYWKRGLLHLKTAFIFAIPSVVSVLVVRKLLLPLIPDIIIHLGDIVLTKDEFLMILFAAFMLLASYNMIKGKCVNCDNTDLSKLNFNYRLMLVEGVLVGGLTGLLGAGGGFLIVPSLVLIANLPMRFAVGTSLLIIAINSLMGFAADLTHLTHINWTFLGIYTSLAIVGISIGGLLSKYVKPVKLKVYFGWFVLVMGLLILIKEII